MLFIKSYDITTTLQNQLVDYVVHEYTQLTFHFTTAVIKCDVGQSITDEMYHKQGKPF